MSDSDMGYVIERKCQQVVKKKKKRGGEGLFDLRKKLLQMGFGNCK